MTVVVIQTPIGMAQECPLEDGHLTYTSVPASVADQIEEAIYQKHQLKGVATYEGEDAQGKEYKYDFPWEVKLK